MTTKRMTQVLTESRWKIKWSSDGSKWYTFPATYYSSNQALRYLRAMELQNETIYYRVVEVAP